MTAVVIVILSGVAATAALVRAWLDHSVMKKQLAALEEKAREARVLLKQRADLASELAHEIKNPIAAILCSAETLDLLIGDKVDESLKKSIHYIREYGDQLLRLLSDFLDLSRLEAGTIEARPEAVRLAPVIESITGLLASNSMRKQIEIESVIKDKNLRAYVDPKHVKQILFNLLHNAIKFTPARGKITVTVDRDEASGHLVMRVADTGQGIPPEELPRLFDVYARFEGNQPSYDTGVGLGLALCKSLVTLAGGTLKVESKVGVGTTFEFTLLDYQEGKILAPEAARLLEARKNLPHRKPLQGEAFLVLDSNAASREQMVQFLKACGGVVDEVKNAKDAVTALAHRDYRAVMVDKNVDPQSHNEVMKTVAGGSSPSSPKIIETDHGTLPTEFLGSNSPEISPYGKEILRSVVKTGRYMVPR